MQACAAVDVIMYLAESDRFPTRWPESDADLPQQPVSRLVYASLSNVEGPVFEEMLRIREHAVPHNAPAGLRVALLYMSGWFVQWIEGPPSGVQALLDRVSQDPRHQGLRVMHRSMGRARLFRPWIGAIVQGDEGPTAFARRLFHLQDCLARESRQEPASVWLRLCAPPAADMPLPHGQFPRAMLLSAQGTQGFDLLGAMALETGRSLVRGRFAAGADEARDVECDYLDLPGLGTSGWRLVGHARKGLAMGAAHAFLPDHCAVIVLMGESQRRNLQVTERVLAVCRQVHQAPVFVALGPPSAVTAELQALVERQGLPWLAAVTPQAEPGLRDLSATLAPVLDRLG